MKLNVLMFKNVAIDAFTTPQFVDIAPEKAAEQLDRSIRLAKDEPQKIAPYRNLQLFNFGEFDDVTGKIDFLEEPELILDCATLVADLGVFVENVN